MNKLIRSILFALGLLPLSPVFAQEITIEDAIQMTLEKNPELSAALADKKSSSLTVEIEQNKLRADLSAETKYSHGVDSFSGASNDSMLLTSELSKVFAVGTITGVGLTLHDTFITDADSTYGATLNLSITQPILRGFGAELNLAGLRSARYNLSTSEASYQSSISATLRDAMIAYWELWYAQGAQVIQEKSLEVIKAQITEAEAKVSFGVTSPSTLLSLQTEEASIEEQLANAKATVRAQSLALSVLLGQEAIATYTAISAPPKEEPLPPRKDLFAKAAERSFDLRSLSAAIDVASVSLESAKDQRRPTLNAIGQLQLATNGGAEDATNSATGFLGLRVELPSSQNAARAQEEKASLAVQAAQDRFDAARSRLEQQVSSQVESITNGEYRLTLAKKTATLAEATVAAEKARFDAGVGTAIELVRVQQQEREAKLRVTRIEVDLIEDQLRLKHLTGDLLPEQ